MSGAGMSGAGMILRRFLWLCGSVAVAAGLVLVWQAVTAARLVNPVFLPSPQATWAALMRGFARGDLWGLWGQTVGRMLIGWLLASLLGIALGAVIGSSRSLRAYLGGILEFIRPLPASAVVPVAITLLGLTEGMTLTVIAFGAVWPTLLATVHGFATVDPLLVEVSRSLRMSRIAVITKIALPNSLPDILAGMRLSVTIALILTVVGEMLASRPGLGSSIMLASRMFQSPQIYAGVILLGLTGYVAAVLLNMAEARLLRWRR